MIQELAINRGITMGYLILGFVFCFLCGLLAAIYATGDKVLAFLIALFLGPFGLLILFIIEYSKITKAPQVSSVRRCRQCRKQISDTSYLCPHCNEPIL